MVKSLSGREDLTVKLLSTYFWIAILLMWQVNILLDTTFIASESSVSTKQVIILISPKILHEISIYQNIFNAIR